MVDTSGLWQDKDCSKWKDALESYDEVIAAQGSDKLTNLDTWYSSTLPQTLAEREEPFLALDELEGVTAWKMSRGVWRERNRLLVSGNDPQAVIEASRKAFASSPDPKQPIKILSDLAGVGAATASAVMAAYAPDVYPFFDELVANQIPGLGPVAFTLKYYLDYARALRERAAQLSEQCEEQWTPQMLSQALWANSGGKIAHPELR
jgi:hypothetical protein